MPQEHIVIKGAREHNLKNINVTFPLNMLTVITGVSGSGKSTLVKKLLYPIILKEVGGYGEKAGQYSKVEGKYKHIKHVEFVDQNPIGRSSRSNPVTYIKAYDDIRNLFASQKLSKIRGYQAKHFSFNVDGGRCEKCKGEGEITVEMQFMADVHLECDTCGGKRFKKEILEHENKELLQSLEESVKKPKVDRLGLFLFFVTVIGLAAGLFFLIIPFKYLKFRFVN